VSAPADTECIVRFPLIGRAAALEAIGQQPKTTASHASAEIGFGPSSVTQAPSIWSSTSTALRGAFFGTIKKGQVLAMTMALGACATMPAVGQDVMTVGRSQSCRVDAELKSWIVAGWGRHLRLDLEGGCGTPAQSLEFTNTQDYGLGPGITSVLSVDPGTRISNRHRFPGERSEGRYRFDRRTVACVTAPRNYEGPYRLFGPNSSSGLHAAMAECGIPLPSHVPGSGGALESFPGVDHDPGPQLR
jgi:predicted small secreted protein